MSARLAAYRLIDRVEGSAYSNIALDGVFKDSSLSERDKAFAARLFYGVIERRITLEHLLSKYLSKPIDKLDKQVRITLMMGAYQLLYMDNVPDSAAVSESAELVKKLKKASAAGMVNAVLRNIIMTTDKHSIIQAGQLYDRRLRAHYDFSVRAEITCLAVNVRGSCEPQYI